MGGHGLLRTTITVPVGIALAVCAALSFPACGDQPGTSTTIDQETASQVESSVPARLAVTEAGQADVAEVAASNNAFSLDLLKAVRSESENLVCSPYSVSLALAMTMAGGRGQTQEEMKQTLQTSLPYYSLNRALNALDQDLTGSGSFNCANSIWGQSGRTFKRPFLDLLAQYYGASPRLIDLDEDYAGACKLINDWVSSKTNGRITDLMNPDDPPPIPRLMMLVNAVHFKAQWLDPFSPGATQKQPFFLLDDRGTIQVPMMWRISEYRFLQTKELQAVELPYEGDRFAMVVIMPEKGGFEEFAARLDKQELDDILAGLEGGRLDLRMPSFGVSSTPSVKEALQAMGMTTAFTSDADFSGIADGDWWITDVAQRAFIEVDEYGTEAAAASGVTMAGASSTTTVPPPEMTIDHPFVYLIYDTQTGAILFIGQMVDPSEGSTR
jgi:serpin B